MYDMYKITLYDYNCSSACDGTTSFFVDQLEDFEKYWLNSNRVGEDTKKRYFRSKSGEIVSDYYSDNPEYNIVQCDENAVVLLEKEYQYNDTEFTLLNAYLWDSKIYAKTTQITLRYIKFNGYYYLIGRYKLSGACRKNLWVLEGEDTWNSCAVYGNPVHITKYKNVEPWIDEAGRYRYSYLKEAFKDDEIETYCWITVRRYNKEDDLDKRELDELSEDLLSVLMADIPGEGG